jgi:PAS domain S-box-containing protein
MASGLTETVLILLCGLLLIALLAAIRRCGIHRRQAESSLAVEQSLKRLSLVASRTTNGVVITDVQGRVEWVNAGFSRISGFTLAEMQGRKPGEVLQGVGTDPATVARISAAMRESRSFEVELLNYAKDLHPYWIHLSVDPLRDEAGELQGYMGIGTDVTARKAAEAALENSAQHSQAVLDSVIDGIITIDRHGLVATFNRAAESIFGYPAAAMIGRNVKLLIPQPYRDEHDSYLRNYQRTGEAQVIGIGREVEGQRQDGSTFPMELSITEISRDGEPFYIGLVRDITERLRLEQLKREFIATVSHELRTPLTSIRGALGLVASGNLATAPAQSAQLIDIALKNSERLSDLIDDLLDMEKIAAGGMRFDLQVQALMPLIEHCVEAIRPYGDMRGVSFRLLARDDAAKVCVDAQRFTQVMANLLSNAAKFSPPGGQVTIDVTRRESWVSVAVRDQGGGIPADFHAHVFTKFCQADASDARQSGGTGLGLAISKELVEHMRGRIGFESEEGEGATFFVDLPLAQIALVEPPNAG